MGWDDDRNEGREAGWSTDAAAANQTRVQRAAYQRPQLLRYGHVSELTRGANGSGDDGGPAYMNRQPQGPWCDVLPWLPWCR